MTLTFIHSAAFPGHRHPCGEHNFAYGGWGHIPFIGLYAPSLKLLNKFSQN